MAKTINVLKLIVIFAVFSAGLDALALNSGVTYQGRILKPDGTALSGQFTQFKMQLRTPDAGSCLMYEEIQSKDLRNLNGMFSVTMSDGTGSRTDTTALNLDKIFANHGSFMFDPTTCASGTGSYTPNPSDGRDLVVLFKDETMAAWEPIPTQKINFVPFAFEAKQVAGFTSGSLVRVAEADGTLDLVSPLSNANYTELLALINGTTTQYSKTNQLSGVAMPSMNSGEVLGWNGSAWVSTSPVPGANTITNAMLQSSSVSTAQIANNVSIATSGTLTSAITTTRDFKIFAASPSTFSIDMQAPPLAASYSLVWPADAGSPTQVLTTDGAGNLSWAAPASSSQWTTAGSNIYFNTGGFVGIGTTAPFRPLTVVGSVVSSAGPITAMVNADGGLGGAVFGSDSNHPVLFISNSAEKMRIAANGNVGIGTTAPSAKLTLPAGTTAAGTAPFKLTTGTNLTTPEDGAMEYASSNLYFTIGATRYVIPTNTAVGNFSNVTTINNTAGSITMSPFGSNAVIINSTATSTSPITGGVIVTGGAGITGAVNASGNIVSGGAVTATTSMYTPQLYGGSAASANIKIDGADNASKGNVLLATAGGSVGIGTTAPAASLDVAGEVKPGNTGIACSAANQGSIRFNAVSKVLEYCNATAWTLVQAAACSNATPGAFAFTAQPNSNASTLYQSNIVQITGVNCAITTQISGNGSPQYRICADNACGTVIQSWTSGPSSVTNNQYIQIQDTSPATGGVTNAVSLFAGGGASVWNVSTTGDCTAASPPIGTLCADGSIYAGMSPDGNVKMYTQRCDIGMSWNGTTCSGTRTAVSFNNGGTGAAYVATGFTNLITGKANTAAFAAAADAGNRYFAAYNCSVLNEDGHTDWYLPGKTELLLLASNSASIGGFMFAWYWASSEYDQNGAYIIAGTDPTTNGTDWKNNPHYTRCVRR